MPSVLASGHSNRFSSHSPPSRLNLYFPPGGHTHDRHTVPPDRLHISLSDPVLVAAEQRLSDVPTQQKQPQSPTTRVPTATKTIKLGSIAFHLKGGIFSHTSHDHGNEPPLIGQALKTVAAATPGPSPAHCRNADFQATATPNSGSLDSPGDSYDICEVVSVPTHIDDGMGSGDSPTSETSPGLAPLASELFREELYVRGYLKRPANRPPSDITVSRKSMTGLVSVSRKVLPNVLGRRQGRKVAERLQTAQVVWQGTTQTTADQSPTWGAAETPADRLDAHQVSTCVTLQTPQADGQQSSGTDSSTSASESFNLHEFSYITAFTTPPSSPSVVLCETSKKAVSLGGGNHAG